MGQYYNAVVLTRKKDPHYPNGQYPEENLRILCPFDYNETLKLFEIAYFGGTFSKVVASQAVKTYKNWLPPRMAIIGDYTEINDAPIEGETEDGHPIYDGQAVSMILNSNMWAKKFLYKAGKDLIKDPDKWIALNHDKKEYVKLGICDTGEYTRADPLILLLAVGNGRGGGDYHGEYEGDVGAWAFDHIEVIHEREPIPEGYREVWPKFEFQ